MYIKKNKYFENYRYNRTTGGLSLGIICFMVKGKAQWSFTIKVFLDMHGVNREGI